ncbi:hypothetical protein J3R30DRAFT_3657726 [Lentinula aciculospora]|uniref:Uncharacterized protein n=1 Tax=Lentinula aciculospora TaxID=153920 RepID=A0A9W9DNE0_9AGAR|nr:hypothetical protein J3R30DRAFT_3657726 [Lentinula aciculospora]
MYNGYSSPPITNNPFISDPTNAQSRYPDLSGSSPSPDPNGSQFTSWIQPRGSQQQYQQQHYQQQMPPHLSGVVYQPTGTVGDSGFISPQFQPSSGFGQQMLGQMTGSSYGYLQGQNSSEFQTSYSPVQQQLQSPGYNNVAQFDPYSSIGGPSSAQQQSSSFQSPVSPISPTTPVTTSRSATGAVHPREYIKTHKAEIESWDTYAWKQLLNTFDDLKGAWASRKNEVDGRAQQLLMQMQYSGGYHPQMQQEAERLRALSREADTNHGTVLVDSVAASSFQMHEVFKGYRQSGDAASKRRVREASNAALQNIPDWPAPGF